jgi:hypothetical protein
MGHSNQVIGHSAHSRYHYHNAVALGFGFRNPASGSLDMFGSGEAAAPIFLND